MDTLSYYAYSIILLAAGTFLVRYLSWLFRDARRSRLECRLIVDGSQLQDKMLKSKCIHYELVAIKHNLPRRFKDSLLEENIGGISAIRKALSNERLRSNCP